MKLIRPQTVAAATLSRASTATYYDADGVVQEAAIDVLRISYEPPADAPQPLIEDAATNLCHYAEDESNAAWVKTELGGYTANHAVAPDGATTADLIYERNSTGGVPGPHRDHQQITVSALDASMTYSRFIAAAGREYINLDVRSTVDGLNGFCATFHLSGEGEVSFGQSLGDGTYTTASIAKLVGDFYRVSITGIPSAADSGTAVNCYTRLANGPGQDFSWGTLPDTTVTRASGGYAQTIDGHLVWFGSNVARITDKGLLIEAASTNLLTRSQEIDNAAWTTAAVTVAANATAAPDGTLTADKLVPTSGSAYHYLYQEVANFQTPSVYVKAAEKRRVALWNSVGDANYGAVFDLVSGTVVATQWGTASIQALANGWYRCSIIGTSAHAFWGLFVLDDTATTLGVSTGNGSDGVYIWGAQAEAAAALTSYIPTTSATVTRAADVVTAAISGLSYPHTLFAEIESLGSSGLRNVLETAVDGSNRTALYLNIGGGAVVKTAGVTEADVSTGTANAAVHKIAARMESNNVVAAFDGVLTSVDASATMPADPDTLCFGADASGANQLKGYLRRIAVFATAKPGPELQTMTTLGADYAPDGDEVFYIDFTGDDLNYLGDGSSGVHVWGAQLEEGAAATSYIPTTSASVTRAADVLSGSGLIYSNVAEDDYAAYDAGTTYALADRVISGHHIYESLAGSNVGNAVTDTAWWLDLGSDNRWKMFDSSVGSQTTEADEITIAFKTTGRADSVSLLNLSATNARITITDSDNVLVHDAEYSLSSTGGVSDWWAYFYEPYEILTDLTVTGLPPYSNATFLVSLTKATGDVTCGACIIGLAKDFGTTTLGAKVGIQDYSIKTTDDFGNFTVLERAYSKRSSYTVYVANEDVDSLVKLLAAYRATPAVYIGDETYASTVIYGFYRDFSLEIAYPNHSVFSIELEGLA